MAFNFPYDVNELLGGRARILTAPTSVAIPDDISDIINMTSSYAPKTGWIDLGATGGPAQYSRNLTTAGYNIQQSTSAVLEEVSDVTRTFAFPAAEINTASLALLEGSDVIESVATASGVGAQDRLRFGTIVELAAQRIAIIGVRKESQGTVSESGGVTRGRLVALVGFNCTITADNSQLSLAEGEMATVPLSFTLNSDEDSTDTGEEYGMWLFEDAGTVPSS